MKYYRADLSNVSELTNLRLNMRKERDNSFCEDELRKNTISFFNRNIENGSHIVFVCEIDCKIIATVGLTPFELPPTDKLLTGKVLKLMNMYTLPKYRKQGISKALLDMSINYAKQNKFEKIMLNSSPLGKSIYEKSGFELIKNEYELYIK